MPGSEQFRSRTAGGERETVHGIELDALGPRIGVNETRGEFYMTKRFIVFERPQGSKTWTMAFKSPNNPASFMNQNMAFLWVRDEHSLRKGWLNGKPNKSKLQAHIAEVELPE